MCLKPQPCRRRRCTNSASFKQPRSDEFLEAAGARAYRRLSDAKRVRRAPEITILKNSQKSVEKLKLHNPSKYPIVTTLSIDCLSQIALR